MFPSLRSSSWPLFSSPQATGARSAGDGGKDEGTGIPTAPVAPGRGAKKDGVGGGAREAAVRVLPRLLHR